MNNNEVEKKNKNNLSKVILILLYTGLVVLAIYVTNGAENSHVKTDLGFSTNIDELPDAFDTDKLRAAIVTEINSSIIKISHVNLSEYGEQISNEILYSDTIGLKIDISSLSAKNDYKFAKSDMELANWKDVSEGDMLYFYQEKSSSKGNGIKTNVAIFVDQEFIGSDEILDVIQRRNLSNFVDESFKIMENEYYWMFFNDKYASLNTEDHLDFESIVNVYKDMKIKYLPVASDLSKAELVCNYNDMRDLKRMNIVYDSFKPLDLGYEVMVTSIAAKNDAIISLKTSKKLAKETKLKLDTNGYKKEDELIVYINNRGKIELIKDLDETASDKTFIGLIVYDEDNNSDLNKLMIEDKFGNEKEVTIDKSLFFDEPYTRVYDLIGEFSLDADDYVLDFKPILSANSPRNTYRLLNVLDGKIELGYKLDGDAKNSDFEIDERVWVELADDLIVFPEESLKELRGESIGIRLNAENQIDFISNIVRSTPITYDFKSPVDVYGESKSSLILEALDAETTPDKTLVELVKLDIDDSTNYYIYNYDFKYDEANPENYQNLLNQNFDKVKNLKKVERNDIDRIKDSNERYRVYLICYDYELNDSDKVRDIIEIIPTTYSRFNISFLEDEIAVNGYGNIDVRTNTKFIEAYEAYDYLDDEFLYSNKKDISGWILLDQNKKAEYIFSLETEPILVENYSESLSKKIIEKYGLNQTFEGVIRNIDYVKNYETYIDVDISNPYVSEIRLKEDQDPKKLFTDWIDGDEFMVYRFTTSNPFGLDSKEDTYLESAVPIKSMNSDIIYRYLGKLDGDMIFGFGGNIRDNDFNPSHSFILNESDISYIENVDYFAKLSDNEVQTTPKYIAAYNNENGDIEFIKDVDFIYELDAKMASKSLKKESLEGKYIDREIEIISVNKNPELKLTIKTSNGKEYEVGSKSDNWKLYEKGQKLKVRLEIKDGVPINICWAEGLEK